MLVECKCEFCHHVILSHGQLTRRNNNRQDGLKIFVTFIPCNKISFQIYYTQQNATLSALLVFIPFHNKLSIPPHIDPGFVNFNFGLGLCCLMTPGLRKDIQCHV